MIRPEINPLARRRRSAALVSPITPTTPPRKRSTRLKRHAHGDYEVGFCKPPKEHQFDGSKPGPGRPRGALSQDTIERKHLMTKLPVTLDGKRKSVQTREVAFVTRLNHIDKSSIISISQRLQRREQAISYAEYLAQVAEFVRELESGESTSYPAGIETAGQRALHDTLGAADTAKAVHNAVKLHARDGWRDSPPKTNELRRALRPLIPPDVFDAALSVIRAQDEY